MEYIFFNFNNYSGDFFRHQVPEYSFTELNELDIRSMILRLNREIPNYYAVLTIFTNDNKLVNMSINRYNNYTDNKNGYIFRLNNRNDLIVGKNES